MAQIQIDEMGIYRAMLYILSVGLSKKETYLMSLFIVYAKSYHLDQWTRGFVFLGEYRYDDDTEHTGEHGESFIGK